MKKLLLKHAGIIQSRIIANNNLARKLSTSVAAFNNSGTSDESHSKHNQYDVIVIGGGHAGCEAATAAARIGAKTALLTHNKFKIGEMSCNPSFGGIGKGHLMKEIDALDGVCARICDVSGIQYRMLNKSKGPAVWGPRAQIDRDWYRDNIQKELFETKNLDIIECSVEDLITDSVDSTSSHASTAKCRCSGVVLSNGETISGRSVVLTAGTFLRGEIHIGMNVRPAGRMGDKASIGLAKTIEQLGFKIDRLRTGTPPRIVRSSIDFTGMSVWNGDKPPQPFSFMNDKVKINPEDQMPCFTTLTKPGVKKIVKDSMHLNYHVKEEINGPRYCPSIESKVLRFTNQDVYNCWLEPEGWESDVIYLQGFSCTMPEEYQLEGVRSIHGLENAEISQWGYGVGYDYMDPRQLASSLETYMVQGLYFAGQINGTTGYEEAAAQGIIAGINAARKCLSLPPFIIGRSEGYIGVLIDDLTTLGTNEPYRMFTTRSEFRMSFRPDNADERLTARGYRDAGCVSEERMNATEKRLNALNDAQMLLKEVKRRPGHWRQLINWSKLSPNNPNKALSAFDFIANVEETEEVKTIMRELPELRAICEDHWAVERIRAEARYSVFKCNQEKEILQLRQDEALLIPEDLNYADLMLKMELREKLALARPQSIAAASRIPGMTPTALVYLLRHIKRTAPVL